MDAERRELLKQAAALMAGFSLSRCAPKKDAALPADAQVVSSSIPAAAPEPPHAFQLPQRKTIEAACARILPSDQDPGAAEANVVEFIDRELARPEYDKLNKAIIGGTVALDRLSARLGGKKFTDLNPEEQDDVILQVQNASDRGRDFVKLLTLLTLEGFGSDPKYGGNAHGVGWQFVGYGPGTHEH